MVGISTDGLLMLDCSNTYFSRIIPCFQVAYLVSALIKDLLTKNTGLNFASPHSLNKAALTAVSEAAR